MNEFNYLRFTYAMLNYNNKNAGNFNDLYNYNTLDLNSDILS